MWTEVFISPDDARASSCVAESLVRGYSLLLVDAVVSVAECEALDAAATAAQGKIEAGRLRAERSGGLSATLACRLEQPPVPTCTDGRIRMPVTPTFLRATRSLCDELLLRVLDLVDEQLPELGSVLGRGLAAELRAAAQPLASSPLLTFTPNEPAINIYTAGGSFEPHRDMQSLTVLVPLVSGDAFEGGGTAFWRAAPRADDDGMPPVDAVERDVAAAPPALLLRPARGTALLWGGSVTHAGQPVTAGQRSVFVASMSGRRT